MKRLLLLIATLLIISLIIISIFTIQSSRRPREAQIISAGTPMAGFARATGPIPITFPEAHGPHLDYQTEWWYYTGNLDAESGNHFGYQLTFFRRALVLGDQEDARSSDWATRQIYFAHFALTDVTDQKHQSFERFERGAAGIAGAQSIPYTVWLDNWRVEQAGDNRYHLRAAQDAIMLDLTLDDLKGPVLQGDRGYSQKGADVGNASYYYSLTRLKSQGTVAVRGKTYSVSGLSWMDHEYSTRALTPDEVGWDWFAIQLDDGNELMLYQFRHSDGTIDPFSSGTLIATDGTITSLNQNDFQIQVSSIWQSPHSGGQYPAKWIVEIPSQNLMLDIDPYLADQELSVSFTYWEGAVRITGVHNGNTVLGIGYIELTGYVGSMAGQF